MVIMIATYSLITEDVGVQLVGIEAVLKARTSPASGRRQPGIELDRKL